MSVVVRMAVLCLCVMQGDQGEIGGVGLQEKETVR